MSEDVQISPEEQERVQALWRRQSAEAQAGALPLPGPAGDASASGPIVIGQFTVRKIVKYDWRVWQMTDNAIIRSMAELSKDEGQRAIPADDESGAVAIWMLTHTCAEVAASLKQGVQAFKDKCVSDIEFEMEAPEFSALFEAVMEQVKRACATALKYAAKKEGQDNVALPFPETRNEQRTASAG